MIKNLYENIYRKNGIEPLFLDHKSYSQELKRGEHSQTYGVINKSFDNIYLNGKKIDRNFVEDFFNNLTNKEINKLVSNRVIGEREIEILTRKLEDEEFQGSDFMECLYRIQFNIEKRFLNRPSNLYAIYSNYAEPFKEIFVEIRTGILRHSIKKSNRSSTSKGPINDIFAEVFGYSENSAPEPKMKEADKIIKSVFLPSYLYIFKNYNLGGREIFCHKPLVSILEQKKKSDKTEIKRKFEVDRVFFLDKLVGKKWTYKKKKTLDKKEQTYEKFLNLVNYFKETDVIWFKNYESARDSKSRKKIIDVLNEKTSYYLENAQEGWSTFITDRKYFEQQQNDQFASLLQRSIWECFQRSTTGKVAVVTLWHAIAKNIIDFYGKILYFEKFQNDPRAYNKRDRNYYSNSEKLKTTKAFQKAEKKKVKDNLASILTENEKNYLENSSTDYTIFARPFIETLFQSGLLIFHSTESQKQDYVGVFLTNEQLNEGKYNLASLNPDFLKVKKFLKDFKYNFSIRESKESLKEKTTEFSDLKKLNEKTDL